jgi:hypothetical protein
VKKSPNKLKKSQFENAQTISHIEADAMWDRSLKKIKEKAKGKFISADIVIKE